MSGVAALRVFVGVCVLYFLQAVSFLRFRVFLFLWLVGAIFGSFLLNWAISGGGGGWVVAKHILHLIICIENLTFPCFTKL